MHDVNRRGKPDTCLLTRTVVADYARRQYPVLEVWAERTAGDPAFREFQAFYRQAMADLERYRS